MGTGSGFCPRNGHQKVFDAAYDAKQFSAAVGANKEISILAGVRVERAEIGQPGEFEAMSDEELWEALQRRFAKLAAELRHHGSIAVNGNGTDTDIEGS